MAEDQDATLNGGPIFAEVHFSIIRSDELSHEVELKVRCILAAARLFYPEKLTCRRSNKT